MDHGPAKRWSGALPVLLLAVLAGAGCLEDDPAAWSIPASELVVDSAAVRAVRGTHPWSGLPGAGFDFDVHYELRGNPGAIYKIEITPYPPGDYRYVRQYTPIFDDDPLPAGVKHVLSDDIWIEHDYAGYDSIMIYLFVEAVFWRDFEVGELGFSERSMRGEDTWFKAIKIDIRDE